VIAKLSKSANAPAAAKSPKYRNYLEDNKLSKSCIEGLDEVIYTHANKNVSFKKSITILDLRLRDVTP